MNMTLPQDSKLRKEYPLYSGLLRYFPAALAGLARHSKRGNDKHNPGQELHHSRDKSNDHADCIMRHLMDLADLLAHNQNSQAILDEVNALFWRAGALSQELHEKIGGAPLAPGAKYSTPTAPDEAHDKVARETFNPHPADCQCRPCVAAHKLL